MARETAFEDFEPGLVRFLRQLERNNNREWFHEHKPRYIEQVRDPMLSFIGSVGPKLQRISPHINADPRPNGGSLFRIYRDVRFSKDKSPYKTHAGAQFRHAAGKDVHAPGFYLHWEPGKTKNAPAQVFAAAGVWHPDSRALGMIRDAIVDDPTAWLTATTKGAFSPRAKNRVHLSGDTLKRAPKGYDPNHELLTDLKRKDFYSMTYFTEEQALQPDFITRFSRAMKATSPLMEFLCDALEVPW